MSQRLSIIIPTLNEAASLAALRAVLRRNFTGLEAIHAQTAVGEAASWLGKEPVDVTCAEGAGRFDVDLRPHSIVAVTPELTPELPNRGTAT